MLKFYTFIIQHGIKYWVSSENLNELNFDRNVWMLELTKIPVSSMYYILYKYQNSVGTNATPIEWECHNSYTTFSYLQQAQYSPQCIHLAEAFLRDLTFFLCSYRLQRYTEKLEREQSSVSSTFSTPFSPLHIGTCSNIKFIQLLINNNLFTGTRGISVSWFKFWFIMSYPQCFMFMGLSILTATLIFSSWSWEPFETLALYHSGA